MRDRLLALHQEKKNSFHLQLRVQTIDEVLKLELDSLNICFFNYLQCGAWQKETHKGMLGRSGHLSVLIPGTFLDTWVMHRHSSHINGQQQRYAFKFWAGGCYSIQSACPNVKPHILLSHRTAWPLGSALLFVNNIPSFFYAGVGKILDVCKLNIFQVD